MIIAFCILQYIATIVLWVSILGWMRTYKIQKDFGIVLSLLLATFFLFMVIKFSIYKMLYYLIGAVLYTLFSFPILARVQKGWRLLIETIVSFIFWPQTLCFAMFMYSINDQQENT